MFIVMVERPSMGFVMFAFEIITQFILCTRSVCRMKKASPQAASGTIVLTQSLLKFWMFGSFKSYIGFT